MDGTVRIWSLVDGSPTHTLSGHTSLVGLLSLSATTLVSAAADSTLRIWDPVTGRLLHTLAGHTGAITCFQHDENKVLSGSDGTLKMWDAKDGSVTRDLLTGINGVWQVIFDRRFCIAASNRQEATFLEVWDFAGDSRRDGNDNVDDGSDGGDPEDEEDNNSETSDPYDELRLSEKDVEDSESENEGGDTFPDSESDYHMESSSSATYHSPAPSGGRGRHRMVMEDVPMLTMGSPTPPPLSVPHPLGGGVSSAHTTTTTTTTGSTTSQWPAALVSAYGPHAAAAQPWSDRRRRVTRG